MSSTRPARSTHLLCAAACAGLLLAACPASVVEQDQLAFGCQHDDQCTASAAV